MGVVSACAKNTAPTNAQIKITKFTHPIDQGGIGLFCCIELCGNSHLANHRAALKASAVKISSVANTADKSTCGSIAIQLLQLHHTLACHSHR